MSAPREFYCNATLVDADGGTRNVEVYVWGTSAGAAAQAFAAYRAEEWPDSMCSAITVHGA